MSTWCSECDFVHPLTLREDPWRWRCMAAPTKPGFGFVSPDYSPSPPYSLCWKKNDKGECLDWTARRLPSDKGE